MITIILNGVILLDWKNIDNVDNISIPKLTKNTANTWQSDRTEEEKAADTMIGKLAEAAFIESLKILGIKGYVSYDEIRDDDFKLHAPFDGVFSRGLSKETNDFINLAVRNEGPKLCAKTRSILRSKGVLTVEIKSTRLAKKYKEKAGFKSYGSEKELTSLVETLRDLDYLTYPFFTRYGEMSFDQYCAFAEKKINSGLKGERLREKIKSIEKGNSDDLYVRVFVDEESKKCLVMGWIDSDRFFGDPETHKLILPGKSEVPLYFVKAIRKGNSLTELNSFLFERLNNAKEDADSVSEEQIDKTLLIKENPADSEKKKDEALKRDIIILLKAKKLKSHEISKILSVPVFVVDETINNNKNMFVRDLFGNWRLK